MNMQHHLRRHKHLLIPFGLLLFVSGCAGAVSKTTEQLSNEAVAPLTVPLDTGLKGIKTLKNVDATQREENAQINAN